MRDNNQYKCIADDFATLDKKIKRIIKKLDKYNLNYTYELLDTTTERIAVYNTDGRTVSNIASSTITVLVQNYIFEMESIKLGNYEVIAILDHTTQNAQCNNNMVYISNSEIELPREYYTIQGNCQHCNSNRKRNTTAVLYNADTKEFKQVGITCLKEYTGIDCIDVIHGFTDIYDIINDINTCNVTTDTVRNYKKYTKTIDYLANCIYLINQEGYIKDATKIKAYDFKEIQDTNCIAIAEKVMSFFKDFDADYNTFLTNIKTAILQEAICYPNGFLAYAYVTYKKELEKIAELAETKSNQVGYYGEVSKRETLTNLKVECITSYTSYFGYNAVVTHIYKLTNELGYIFIWKTQNSIESDFISELKGTIKEHKEFNGEQQTELTRCKIIK